MSKKTGQSKKNPHAPGTQPDQLINPMEDVQDRPEQAVPSGEPKVVGRSHGYIIDDNGEPAGRRDDQKDLPPGKEGDEDQDWESGRHQAVE